MEKLFFAYQSGSRGRGPLGNQGRAPGNDLKSKGGGAPGDRASGSSQPKNSESFSFQFDAGRSLPASPAQRMIRARNPARKRENHSKHVLRHGGCRGAGCDCDNDAQFGGGANVDPVRAGGSDQAELRERSQNLPVEHRPVADSDRHSCALQPLEQLVVIRRNLGVDGNLRRSLEARKLAGFLKGTVDVVAYNNLNHRLFQPLVKSSLPAHSKGPSRKARGRRFSGLLAESMNNVL